MKSIKIIIQIALLYAFSFVGYWLRNMFHLPIPGSIIGLILLFITLTLNICRLQWIELGAGFLLKYLPMVFIPSTVGVMNYIDVFAGHGVILLIIVVISTAIVMMLAGCTSQFLAVKVEKRKEKKLCQSQSS